MYLMVPGSERSHLRGDCRRPVRGLLHRHREGVRLSAVRPPPGGGHEALEQLLPATLFYMMFRTVF